MYFCSQKEEKMRDNSVTIAKGIAIILMVMGHGGCPDGINEYLHMLRMPLFFFMSGYCFKIGYLNDCNTFMKKRIKGIYQPYIKWTLFFFILHNVFFHLNIYNTEFGLNGQPPTPYTIHDIPKRLYHIFISIDGNEPLTGPFWFLKSLFWGSIIFYITRKLCNNILIGILLLLSITFVFSYFNFSIPILVIKAKEFLAAVFISCGHLYKVKKIDIKTSFPWIASYAVIVGIGAYLIPTSMLRFNYMNVIPYTICALIGTLMIFGISKNILKMGENWFVYMLIYTGNHTFNILTWHLLSFKIVSLFIVVIYGMRIQHLAETYVIHDYAKMGWWIAYTLIGNLIPLLWLYYYTKIKKSLVSNKTS